MQILRCAESSAFADDDDIDVAGADPPYPAQRAALEGREKKSGIAAVAMLVLLARAARTILVAADLAPPRRVARIAAGVRARGRRQRSLGKIGLGNRHLVLAVPADRFEASRLGTIVRQPFVKEANVDLYKFDQVTAAEAESRGWGSRMSSVGEALRELSSVHAELARRRPRRADIEARLDAVEALLPAK